MGDEGKWMWMARISGQAKDRLINASYMDANQHGLTNTPLANVIQPLTNGSWNEAGMNSTVYKLLTTTAEAILQTKQAD